MKKESARELLEKFYRHVNDKNGKLTVTWDDVETFLSTLPDEKEESGWISVDKELPPSGNCVLLYSETGGVAEGAWIESKNIFEQWRWNAKKTDVTHWMPLPKFNLSNK